MPALFGTAPFSLGSRTVCGRYGFRAKRKRFLLSEVSLFRMSEVYLYRLQVGAGRKTLGPREREDFREPALEPSRQCPCLANRAQFTTQLL
jgi:hypothetical protein